MAKHMRFQQMNKALWFCRIESVARIFFLVLGMFVLHFFTVCVCVCKNSWIVVFVVGVFHVSKNM